MKRVLALSLLFVLCCGIACAVESDEVIYVEQGTCILEAEGVSIIINDSLTTKDSWINGRQLVVPIIIENSTDKKITLIIDDASVNGWACESSLDGNVPAGKKKKTCFIFNLADTDIQSLDEFEEAEFTLCAYDADNWFGEKVFPATAPIILVSDRLKPGFNMNGENAEMSEQEGPEEIYEKADPHLLEILKTGSTVYSEEEKNKLFDPSSLVWQEKKISFSKDQLSGLKSIYCNLFFETDEGYIDMGFDPFVTMEDYSFVYSFDNTWLSIDRQPVYWYRLYYWEDGDKYCERITVPALLNDVQTNLLVDFTDVEPYGIIVGGIDIIPDDPQNNIDDAALIPVEAGDHIQFLCPFIGNDGNMYTDIKLGSEIVLSDVAEIGNTYINIDIMKVTYCFIDNEDNKYWTPLLSVN